MTRFRRRAPLVVWALVITPCFLAAVAAAQGTSIDLGLGAHLPEMLSIIGTGLACFGIAQRQAEQAKADARVEREKDIKLAVHVHETSSGAHVAASTKVHSPFERTISSMGLRIHDIEGSLARLTIGMDKLVLGQDQQEVQLLKLIAEHDGIRETERCMVRDIAGTQRHRAGDAPDFDPTLLRLQRAAAVLVAPLPGAADPEVEGFK